MDGPAVVVVVVRALSPPVPPPLPPPVPIKGPLLPLPPLPGPEPCLAELDSCGASLLTKAAFLSWSVPYCAIIGDELVLFAVVDVGASALLDGGEDGIN